MWQFSPLQDDVLKHSPTGINIDAFIYITPLTIDNSNCQAMARTSNMKQWNFKISVSE